MALTILVGAAALTDVFDRRLHIDPGFEPANLLTMGLVLPEHRYDESEARVRFTDQLERQLETLPGSDGYALANTLPRTRNLPFSQFTVDGEQYEENEEPRTSWLSVNSTYFETMEIGLRQGRTFAPSDRTDAPLVVIVNQRMVDQFFADQTPVGARITINDQSREIVGVVNNIAQQRLTGVQPYYPAVYFPLAQRPLRGINIVLRAGSDPLALAVPAQEAVWALDAEQPITEIETMEQHMRLELAGPSVLSNILFIVGLLALALAAIGIYGVMAYSVSQQTNEIGIRMALGAKPRQVLSNVAGQGATLAGIGILIGVPAALLLIRMIGQVLTASASDGLETVGGIAAGPLLVVSGILIGVGLIACFLPARRATRIDPATALQYE